MFKKSRLPILLLAAFAVALPTTAGIVVTIDGPTLQEMLSAVVTSEHDIELTGGNTLRVRLDDLRVLGFEPSAEGRPGRILATVAVSAPDLGMNMKLRPRIALDVVDTERGNMLDIKLEGLEIPVAVRHVRPRADDARDSLPGGRSVRTQRHERRCRGAKRVDRDHDGSRDRSFRTGIGGRPTDGNTITTLGCPMNSSRGWGLIVLAATVVGRPVRMRVGSGGRPGPDQRQDRHARGRRPRRSARRARRSRAGRRNDHGDARVGRSRHRDDRPRRPARDPRLHRRPRPLRRHGSCV